MCACPCLVSVHQAQGLCHRFQVTGNKFKGGRRPLEEGYCFWRTFSGRSKALVSEANSYLTDIHANSSDLLVRLANPSNISYYYIISTCLVRGLLS